jgi:FAD/FMN-containing dehydrogenase
MTALTTADIGRRGNGSSVAAIDGFRGRLIGSDHADYDHARAVWNGAIDRRPRLIAQCIGTADVVAAIRFARDHDLEIAIRGGGHNVAGTTVCDGGIGIDMSAMRGATTAAGRACRAGCAVAGVPEGGRAVLRQANT